MSIRHLMTTALRFRGMGGVCTSARPGPALAGRTSGSPGALASRTNGERRRTLLFFGSNRPPGNASNFDLYVSSQNSDRSFGPPTFLSELNTLCTEQRPSIRSDGLEIFFHSNRAAAGGAGCANNTDLWVA